MTDPFSEPVTLTPEQAAREIVRIEGYSEALLHRVGGLTWMIWALVSGGIFVSEDAIGISAPRGALAILGYGFAWVPWVILGTVATVALWRSLAVVIPRGAKIDRRMAAAIATTFLILVLGGSIAVAVFSAPISPPAWPMFAIGVAAAVVGGSGLTTDSRSERAFWVVGGALLATLTVGISLAAGAIGYDPLGLFLVVGPVSSTSLLFGGGLYTLYS